MNETEERKRGKEKEGKKEEKRKEKIPLPLKSRKQMKRDSAQIMRVLILINEKDVF